MILLIIDSYINLIRIAFGREHPGWGGTLCDSIFRGFTNQNIESIVLLQDTGDKERR